MMTTTLVPGVYTVEADAVGYRPVRNVIVALDSNKTENVVLQMLSDGNYTVTFYVNAISPTGTRVYITSSNYVGNIFKAPLTMTVRVFEMATYRFHAYSEVTPGHVIGGDYVINISPQSPRYININIPLVFAISEDVL